MAVLGEARASCLSAAVVQPPSSPLAAAACAAVLWSLAEQRKQGERAAQPQGDVEGQNGKPTPTLQPAFSSKGDRFFSNIVPSFARRERGSMQQSN
jgi:hypothetical protein